ncbi:MAG: hypothetical protein JNL70_01375 [Saprospiraceae bacterium]|nr:hypothetical protein [Saprospiraceae bacterium]
MQFQKADDSNLKELINSSELPVAVFFIAKFCPFSKKCQPVVERVAYDKRDSYKFLKVDINESPKSIEQYNIVTIPKLVVFRKGRSPEQLGDLERENELREFLC